MEKCKIDHFKNKTTRMIWIGKKYLIIISYKIGNVSRINFDLIIQ